MFYLKDIGEFNSIRIMDLYRGITDEQEMKEANTLCKDRQQLHNFFRSDNEKCLINLVVSYGLEKDVPFYDKD